MFFRKLQKRGNIIYQDKAKSNKHKRFRKITYDLLKKVDFKKREIMIHAFYKPAQIAKHNNNFSNSSRRKNDLN